MAAGRRQLDLATVDHFTYAEDEIQGAQGYLLLALGRANPFSRFFRDPQRKMVPRIQWLFAEIGWPATVQFS